MQIRDYNHLKPFLQELVKPDAPHVSAKITDFSKKDYGVYVLIHSVYFCLYLTDVEDILKETMILQIQLNNGSTSILFY
jgi:hypothetical protein